MKAQSTLTKRLVAPGVVALACYTLASPATAQDASLTNTLDVPGTRAVASLEASGVQIYECKQNSDGTFQWTFKAPDAYLYDDAGALAVRHFAGPSWRANDGSQIQGKVLRQAPSNTPNSIPQLLLTVQSIGAKGMLSDVQYVQRLATVGGVAPARPCTSTGEEGRSPYLARYVFLR
ncbi:DUF3455 domain-containing protein [Burkholderia guangdongensis]|uniref:DUF3455 domain-containing protein n=1 Tax=Burkholderia guangdongensis TaxID=1792500 RepID=UPI0015CCE028|nr:DUF3455 domain-containing protein [Burkholderia guangdongensis]